MKFLLRGSDVPHLEGPDCALGLVHVDLGSHVSTCIACRIAVQSYRAGSSKAFSPLLQRRQRTPIRGFRNVYKTLYVQRNAGRQLSAFAGLLDINRHCLCMLFVARYSQLADLLKLL